MANIKPIDNLGILTDTSLFSKNMKFTDWDKKIKYRGVDYKQPEQLDVARAFYEKKIPELIAKNDSKLATQITRLKDKYACVVMEQAYREANMVSRELHNTVYYIDLDGGNNGNTGLSIAQAWLTLEQYTTTTVRSAGDIAYVRANTSEISGGISCDELGEFNNPISIIGCDAVTHDPWSDSSNVLPLLDFDDTGWSLETSDFWTITRLDIRGGTSGGIIATGSRGISINDCIIRENPGDYGVNIKYGKIHGCSFYDNTYQSIFNSGGILIIEDCIFNGGSAEGTVYAIGLENARIYLDNCSFGVTTQYSTSSLTTSNSVVIGRNNSFSNDISLHDGLFLNSSHFYSEDHNQVKGAQYSGSNDGIVEKDISPELDGLPSILMSPYDTTGEISGLGLTISHQFHHDYAIWCPASATTVTIKARETAAWAADPTAAQFYFEASYLNHATSATRSIIASAQALSGTTEISFTMTFTPAQVGWAYIICYLKAYEAGKTVNVSVKPAIT